MSWEFKIVKKLKSQVGILCAGFSTFQVVIQLRLTSNMFTGKGRVHKIQGMYGLLQNNSYHLSFWCLQHIKPLYPAAYPQTGVQCWPIPPASPVTWDPPALGRRRFLPRFCYIDVKSVLHPQHLCKECKELSTPHVCVPVYECVFENNTNQYPNIFV